MTENHFEEEHLLLKLWKECVNKIKDVEKIGRIEAIPVYLGVFIEEFAYIIDVASKEMHKEIKDYEVKGYNLSEPCSFSTINPLKWGHEWLVDCYICLKDKRRLKDDKYKDTIRGLFTGLLVVPLLYDFRNNSAHYNKREWCEKEPVLKDYREQFEKFLCELVKIKELAEKISEVILRNPKSKLFKLSARNLLHGYFDSLSFKNLTRTKFLLEINKEIQKRFLLSELRPDEEVEICVNRLIDEFEKEYKNHRSGIYEQKLEELSDIFEQSFLWFKKPGAECLKSFKQWKNSLREVNIPHQKNKEPQDVHLIRLASCEDKIQLNGWSYFKKVGECWEGHPLPMERKSVSEKEFIGYIKGIVRAAVGKKKIRKPQKDSTILLFECEDLTEGFDVFYPWDKLPAKQPLTSQFGFILTMINEDEWEVEEYREAFIPELQISQQMAFSYHQGFDWEDEWARPDCLAYAIEKKSGAFGCLINCYDINKLLVCVSSRDSLLQLEGKLSRNSSMYSIFQKIREINDKVKSSDDYISCVISNEDWVPIDEEELFGSSMSPVFGS